jgi:peptide/nickel transport system substrate-binding protein
MKATPFSARTTSSRARLTWGAIILLLATLYGCGDDSVRTAPEDSAVGETVSGGPAGGVLVVLADREPDQLNPLTFNSTPAYQAVYLMFRGLARRDSTLSGYAPDLAQSWQFENDSTLVIRLRTDVHWHDGTPVTAEDVAFTIERQRDPATGSPRQADVAAVTGVEVRDAHTLAVTMSRSGLYSVNALLEVVPVPRHLLADVPVEEMRNAPFARAPVGNGYYRFTSWTAGQSLTLDVNADRPGGRAAIDRIIMRFVPEMNAAMSDMLAGRGDVIPKLPPNQKQRAQASSDIEVYGAPRIRPAWLAWNTRRAPLDDVRVRRAILMAIDRDALARGLFDDVGEAAYSPVPAALREHSTDARPLPFDTAAARGLLEEAGWRDTNRDGILDRAGRPLRIEIDFISTDQTRQDVLVAIQSMLRRVGVDIAPRAYESSTWVQRLREGTFAGSFWGWGWGPGVVGPNAEMVFHSRSIPPNGANFAASRNPRIDELIDRTLVVTDTAQARAIWRELEQLMIDDAVYAPIYMDPELAAVHARVSNVRLRGLEWVEDVPHWYIEPAARLGRDRVR